MSRPCNADSVRSEPEAGALGGGIVPAPGDVLDLRIESVGYRGVGVARTEGMVVLVPETAVGEAVRIRVLRRKRRHLEGRLVAVLTPSPLRRDPPVHVLPGNPPGAMPGCVYGHLEYREECRLKREQLASFLERAGLFRGADVPPIFPSPANLHYRNKIVLHAQVREGETALGYVGEDNRTVVDLPRCPLAMAPLNERLRQLRSGKEFRRRAGRHRRLVLRWTEPDGALAWWDRAARGDDWLREDSPLGRLLAPRGAFYQVNPPVAHAVMRQVEQWIEETAPERVLDLYCGVGGFALAAAAKGVPEVRGIDSHAEAIRAARENALRMGRTVRFECLDAAEALRDFPAGAPERDRTCLVLDPPRRGVSRAVLEAVRTLRPGTVLYVSCAPDTLVRDLAVLREHGYRVRDVSSFDMFPRTAAFETVVRLET